jgi:hypothetical protein
MTLKTNKLECLSSATIFRKIYPFQEGQLPTLFEHLNTCFYTGVHLALLTNFRLGQWKTH